MSNSVKSILIVKPSSLGDIFHTFPALALLRQAYPEAEFDWLVNPVFADALKFAPVKIRRAIPFERKKLASLRSFFSAFFILLKKLRSEKYDLVVDFQGLLRSSIFAFLSSHKELVGFATPKESVAKILYGTKINIPQDKVHAVDRNMALVEILTGQAALSQMPNLADVPEISESAKKTLQDADISETDELIGIIPGARWESKCWPPEFFAKVMNKILEKSSKYKFILIGSPSDTEVADKIIELTSSSNVISLVGKTSIAEMIEVIRRCECILSNDSGPVHIAAALKKKVYGMFGPTDPDKTGPYGNYHEIFSSNLPCLKCLKRICPLGTNECHDLNIDEIADKLLNHK
jgi:lipopolysaccharide heptosyltransferase I